MIIKYIVVVQNDKGCYHPYGFFKTIEEAEAFHKIMGGAIEEIECFEEGES